MSPGGSQPPAGPAGGWRTPDPRPVPPPQDAANALAVPGSRRELWRYARTPIVGWPIELVLIVVLVVLIVRAPGPAIVYCYFAVMFLGGSLLLPTIGVIKTARRMRDHPWQLYHASVSVWSRDRVRARMEIWRDNDRQRDHRYFQVITGTAKRPELRSGMYRYVWIAGDLSGSVAVVPAGGGPLLWARRDPAATRRNHQETMSTPEKLAAFEARQATRSRKARGRGKTSGATPTGGPSS